jgi:phosphatidylglycerophosphate synthase
VRPLVNTAVTPNQLTAVRLLGGLAAGAAFAVGDPWWTNVAAALFVVSMFLDRADGELARLSGKTSAWGHKFDLVSDSLANAVAFIGIGIGLRDSALGLWAPVLGVIAGAAVAMVLWLVMRLEDGGGERAGELGGFAGADPDDAMIVVPIVMALGGAMPLLIAAAVGAPAFTMIFYFLFRRALKAQTGVRP